MLSPFSWGVTSQILPLQRRNLGTITEQGLDLPRRHRRGQRRSVPLYKERQRVWYAEVMEKVLSNASRKPYYLPNPLGSEDDSKGSPIDWDRLPDGLDPTCGGLSEEKARKKRQQIENLALALRLIIRDGATVVEFCAGSGYVVLPLAFLFPSCRFVLLDKKRKSIEIAEDRIRRSGLQNVSIFCGLVEDYHDQFDVGIALHACGEATDLVQEKCLAAHAAYVLAPCCVGKVKHSKLPYPRSGEVNSILSKEEYLVLAKAADFGHRDIEAFDEMGRGRRLCKTLIEFDRNLRAEESPYGQYDVHYGILKSAAMHHHQRQYRTFIMLMAPKSATPKNDVIFGLPLERREGPDLEGFAGREMLIPERALFASS